MSTWMVIATVWMMFAICVVLFVRGASPHVDHFEDSHDDVAGASGEGSRAKIS